MENIDSIGPLHVSLEEFTGEKYWVNKLLASTSPYLIETSILSLLSDNLVVISERKRERERE